MKATLYYLFCTIAFVLSVLADGSDSLPLEEIRRQIQIFDSAENTDAKLEAASLLAQLIQSDSREEEFARLFREQADAAPAATAPLLALSECMRVWDCPTESARLLGEATQRQPSDFKLQALLAERLEQAGEPTRAAPILASLVAEHCRPEYLRQYAAFLFRTGDIDRATTFASQLAHEAKDGREPEALVQELLSLREWATARDFLSPLLLKFPTDWRLTYLHAYALESLAPDATAFATFRALTMKREEIPGFIPPVNDSEQFRFFNSPERQQYLSQLTPEDALKFRYNATASTAYPAGSQKSRYFIGGGDFDPAKPLALLDLPATVLDLRLNALRHCFTVAARLPVAERTALLAQLNAPDLTFLEELKSAPIAPPDAQPALVRPNAAPPVLISDSKDEKSIKLTEISKALQTAIATADYPTAADLTNQAIKLPAPTHSRDSLIFFQPNRRTQYLYRITSKPPQPLSPSEIRKLFKIDGLVQSFAARGATFLNAPPPQPPPLSPAHQELLKILGETIHTQEPAAPLEFKITDSAKFLTAVATVESPFHRVLILHACGMEAALRQTLADLTKDEASPGGDLLLWASAYQAIEGHDLPLAYKLATRARAALDSEHHAAADTQLVTLGLLLLKEKDTSPDLSAAKSAALGFSRFAVDESSRKELADIFKSLGLNEAAAQLAQPHIIAAIRSREISPPRKSPQDAAAAAAPADRPAALRLLYRDLRINLRYHRLDRSSLFSPNELIHSIKKLQLVPDLAVTMLPPAGASYERRRDYALIMAKLDDLSKVVPLLETLHSERPEDAAILSLLCAASPMPRRSALFGELCRISTDDLSDFAEAMTPKLLVDEIDGTDAYRRMIGEWRTIPALLAALPPEKSTSKHLAWLTEVAVRLASSEPSFYDFIDVQQGYRDFPSGTASKGGPSLPQLRDAAVKEVAIAMLKHPETATHGFNILAVGKSPFGLNDEALDTMAMDAYRTVLSAADFQESVPDKRYITYHRDGHLRKFRASWMNLSWEFLSPFRHLLTRATARNSFYQVTEILPALPEPARIEMTAWLDYFAKPTPAAAIALLRTLDRECQTYASDNVLTLTLEIMALCNLNSIPGLEMLVDQASVIVPLDYSGFDRQGRPQISALMDGIFYHFDTREISALAMPLLTRAAARVLGPPSCWPLYAAALADGSQDFSTIGQRRRTFTSILNLGQTTDKIDLTRFRLGLASGLLDIENDRIEPPTVSSYCNESRCATELIATGLFQPGPGMFFSDGTFLPLKVAHFGSDNAEDDPAKTVGTTLLSVDGPNRFWARIAGAYWARRDATLPLAEVTHELATIKQWSPIEQRALARFLKQRWPDLATSNLAEWLDQALAPDSAELETALRQLKGRFAADSVKAVEIPPLLFPVIEHAPQRAAALWLEMLTTAPAVASQHAHRLLVEALLDYQTPYPTVADANQLTFLLTLLQSSNLTIANQDHGPVLEKFTRRLIDSPPLAFKPDPGLKHLIGIRSKAFAALLLYLRSFDDSAAAHLVDALIKNHSGLCDYSAESSQAFLKWLEITIAPDRPLLAKAARLVDRAGSPPPNPLPAIEPLDPVLLEFLKAPKLTSLTRLHLLQTACETLEPLVHGPQITREAVAILASSELHPSETAVTAFTILTKLEPSPNLTPELAATCCTQIIPKLRADGALPKDHRSWIQPAWLRFAAKSGQDALFTPAHDAAGAAITGNLDLIMLLLEHGMAQSAATLAPPPQLPTWTKADQESGYSNDREIPCFTATIQSHLPRFLQRIPNAAQRFRLELLIANFSDAEGAEKATTSHAERLRQLSARYLTEAPSELLARSELLAILGAGEPPVNLNEMLTLTAGLSYTDLFDFKSLAHESYDVAKARPAIIRLALIEQTIEATLRAGRTDYWFKQMADLARFSDLQNKADHFWPMTKLFDTYAPKFISLAMSAPATEHDRVLREAKALVLPFANSDHEGYAASTSDKCYQFLLLTHLATGHGKDFVGCWKSLPDFLTKFQKSSPEYWEASAFECFRQEDYTASDGSNTTSRLFSALLRDPDLSALILPRTKYLYRFNESKFVTREEISDAIEAVPDSFPRKADYLIGRADLLGYHDAQTAIALKDIARAIQLAEAQHQTAIVELAKATQVRILVRGDRNPEATKISTLVDATQLDEQERKDLTHYREFLKSKSGAQ